MHTSLNSTSKLDVDDLSVYLAQIKRTPLLTPDEERHLAGEIARRYQIIRQAIAQVMTIGKKTRTTDKTVVAQLATIREASDAAGLSMINLQTVIAATTTMANTTTQRTARKDLLTQARRIQRTTEDLEPLIERMVAANLRLVLACARHYIGHNLCLSDLVQDGNLGLIKAVERYTLEHNSRFSTYATWWIRQTIVRGLSDKSRTIRIPSHVTDSFHKIQRAQRRLSQQLHRNPTAAEIARLLKSPVDKVQDVLDAQIVPLSFETPLTTDEDLKLQDVIADTATQLPDEKLEHRDRRQVIASLLSVLEPRWADVLRMRFGIDRESPMTLDGVGEILGVSRERVRQLEVKAMRLLMNHIASTGKTYEDYLGRP